MSALNNEDLRSDRKIQYSEGKRQQQSKLQKEKFKSWQQYCPSTEQSNPPNAIYKIASGKLRSTTCLTTLQQPEWTFTLDAESTKTHTLDYFVPEDNEANNSAVHKQIRQLIKEPIDTEDDKTLISRRNSICDKKNFNPKRFLGSMD